ncbi:hypothetical protein CASFOL_005663 [Castilleja foliolosa]|uniref:Uncharacterized protein n=1 Tax=Castilleja foliolosa TaxID=1961234 RepID=A0ABD3E431_9LAMI
MGADLWRGIIAIKLLKIPRICNVVVGLVAEKDGDCTQFHTQSAKSINAYASLFLPLLLIVYVLLCSVSFLELVRVMVFGARGGSAMEDPAAAGAARRRFIGRLAKNMESSTRNSRYYTDRDGHMSSHGASRVSVCSDFGYFEELYSYYTTEKAWHLCDPNAEQVFMALKKAGVKVAVVSNFDTRLRLLLRALKCDHWRISEAMDIDMFSCIRWQSIVIDEYHQLSQKDPHYRLEDNSA